jgi:hypothetical protein
MDVVLRPRQLLLLILAGWINRQQQDVIEYLLTENQVLREKLGKKRILLHDDQRRRLAVKGKARCRERLGGCCDTIIVEQCRSDRQKFAMSIQSD